MTTNASLVYYLSKCKDIDELLHKKTINELLALPMDETFSCNETKINTLKYNEYFDGGAEYEFELYTTYPGLLLGTGNANPPETLKDADKNSYNLGFYFDYTTGMPIIPGSTIKGILKSVFPALKGKHKDSEDCIKYKLEYINNIIGEIRNIISKKFSLITEDNWEEIFFHKKHIFYDAYITQIPATGDFKNMIFADDYIAPHHQSGIYKEPKPIHFLKIAPNVRFKFQFDLGDYEDIDANTISQVFEDIILKFGIGAKRNVGYGAFNKAETQPAKEPSKNTKLPPKESSPSNRGGKRQFDQRINTSSKFDPKELKKLIKLKEDLDRKKK